MPQDEFREKTYLAAEELFGENFDSKENFFKRIDSEKGFIENLYKRFKNCANSFISARCVEELPSFLRILYN